MEKGKDVEYDDAKVIVGPGWGPDMDEEMSQMVDSLVIEGQRNKLIDIFTNN